MIWSPEQYVAFEVERTRPVRDLLSAVPTTTVRSAVDVGCGPGNSTEALVGLFPAATVSAFDSSPDMIEMARKRLPQVNFDTLDVATWAAPGPFDVILGNAVFQWVPEHARILAGLTDKLSSGGSLAIQMPDNLDEPAHLLMCEIATDARWANKLAGAAGARTKLAKADQYYALLRPACARVDVWRTTYHHPLQGGAQSVVEWFKGSGLRPFLEPLDGGEREAYLSDYTAAVARAYPPLPDGTVLLPFPRLFMVATR